MIEKRIEQGNDHQPSDDGSQLVIHSCQHKSQMGERCKDHQHHEIADMALYKGYEEGSDKDHKISRSENNPMCHGKRIGPERLQQPKADTKKEVEHRSDCAENPE